MTTATQAAKFTQDAKQAPSGAFVFESSQCKFAPPSARDASGLRRAPIEVLARTGKPVTHWYWGRIVHDLSGMRSREKLAFDCNHDYSKPIGYADKITIDGGLKLSGELISRHSEDAAAEIMDLAPAGVPYQASIQFNPDAALFEYLDDNQTATVNGETVQGPLVIVRQWELLRCALCLTGVDTGTSANLSGTSDGALFSVRWKEQKSMTTTKTTEPAGEKLSDGQTKPEGDLANKAPVIDASAVRSQFQAELKRFTDRFGSDGASYFSDGLDYTAALEKHCEKVEAALKSALSDKETAESKLKQVNLGETQGVDTGKPGTSKAAKFSDSFRSKDAAAK
jgi:hypothetical protein